MWLERYTDNVEVRGSSPRRPTVTSGEAAGYDTGGLAQLARAPALHAGGQRFDSVILHNSCVSLGYTKLDILWNE